MENHIIFRKSSQEHEKAQDSRRKAKDILKKMLVIISPLFSISLMKVGNDSHLSSSHPVALKDSYKRSKIFQFDSRKLLNEIHVKFYEIFLRHLSPLPF